MCRAGGIWVNLGPLQYHFSTTLSEDSLEPSYEEVKEIIRNIGFVIKKEEIGIKTTYSQNPSSMLKHIFECVFFVCEKPVVVDTTRNYGEQEDDDALQVSDSTTNSGSTARVDT
uniref:N2227 domain-containing protein n=1 Tax=Rhodnius prolixus TaxID=13249 RepID=T1H7V4_RHOPR